MTSSSPDPLNIFLESLVYSPEVNDFKEVQFSNAPVPAFLSVVMSTVFKEVQFLNAFSARA